MAKERVYLSNANGTTLRAYLSYRITGAYDGEALQKT